MEKMNLEQPVVSLGFIPLTDCAPLVVAHERGCFEKYGLEVTLSKETSWANMRDKLAIGVLDGAQMLAPMTLAMSLGLGPLSKPVIAAMSLGLNGNAITISESLYARMQEVDTEAMHERPISARALKKIIEQDQQAGNAPLSFAVVFPYSMHNYALRYWMAAAGIDPDRDVRIEVIPPAQMVSNLREGNIDGYCVGEPWSGEAVREGLGRVIITGYEIWNNGPEKVFAVTQEWAEQHPNTLQALVMALLEATAWLDAPENRHEAVELIAQSRYVNASMDVIRMSMLGTFRYAHNEFPRSLPAFNVFARYAANLPWHSHAVWQLTQMLRWGQLDESIDLHAVAQAVYRPDITRKAAAALNMSLPMGNQKGEGCHAEEWCLVENGTKTSMGADSFFDAQCFDPRNPIAYLTQQNSSQVSVDLQTLLAMNPARTDIPLVNELQATPSINRG